MSESIIPQPSPSDKHSIRVRGRFRQCASTIHVVQDGDAYFLVHTEADTALKCTCLTPGCAHEQAVAETPALLVDYLNREPGMMGHCPACGGRLLLLVSPSGHLAVTVCARGCSYGAHRVVIAGDNGRRGRRARTATRYTGR